MEILAKDLRDASNIVEQLIGGTNRSPNLVLGQDLVISDLEDDAHSFNFDLEVFKMAGRKMPALLLKGSNDFIPVSLQSLFGKSPPPLPYPDKKLLKRVDGNISYPNAVVRFAGWLREQTPFSEFHLINSFEAREAFTKRAIEFLSTRVAAVRKFRESDGRKQWGRFSMLSLPQTSGGNSVSTPGCHFSVSTKSIGLRVHWSGAYRVSWNYFGHPTSPATNILQAGTYIFGVDDGIYGHTIQPDHAIVSLPGTPSVHLGY